MPAALFEDNDNDVLVEGLFWPGPGANAYVNDAELVCSFGSKAAGETGVLTAATNASPIVVTAAGHGLADGDVVLVYGVQGTEAANGTWTVASATADTFALAGSEGDGVYTGGGAWHKGLAGGTAIELDYIPGSNGNYRGVLPGTAGHAAGQVYRRIVYAVGSYAGQLFFVADAFCRTRS